MLKDIIDAVLAEEKIMLKLARGELVEDRCGIIRDKEGHYSPENTEHHQSLATYTRDPILFTLVEGFHFMFHPIKAAEIQHYIYSKEKKKVNSRV